MRLPSLNHDSEKKEDRRKYEQLKKYLSPRVQGTITPHWLMCEHLSYIIQQSWLEEREIPQLGNNLFGCYYGNKMGINKGGKPLQTQRKKAVGVWQRLRSLSPSLLHACWDCLCRVASGLAAATFSSCILCVSVVSSLVTALLSVWYEPCLHLLWGAHEEFQLGLQNEEIQSCSQLGSLHSEMQSWLHAGWAGSGAAGANRAVLGFSNNHCSSV